MIWRKIIPLFLAVALIVLLVRRVDWVEAKSAFAKADFALLLMAVSITALFPLLGAVRWQCVLGALQVKIPFSKSLESIMIAFSMNVFAPAKAGDFIKAYVLKKDISVQKSIPGIVAERLGDMLILGLMSLIGGLIIHHRPITWISLSLVAGIILAILGGSKLSFGWVPDKLKSFMQMLKDGCAVWRESSCAMLKSLFWSFLVWVFAGIQITLFFGAFGVSIKPWVVLALFPTTILATLLPLTPGGLGVREAAFVFLFLPYAKTHVSVAVSLGYYLCNSWLVGLLGVGFIYVFLNKQDFRQGLNFKDLT